VLTFGGEFVRTVAECQKVLAELRPGQEITMLVKRKNDVLTFTLTTVEDKGDAKKPK
jgi:hypothetical protein